VEPEPPWNDESFDTSEGGVEKPPEVLAETQILPPEPEVKNQNGESDPPCSGESFETSEGGSETPPSPPEPRAKAAEERLYSSFGRQQARSQREDVHEAGGGRQEDPEPEFGRQEEPVLEAGRQNGAPEPARQGWRGGGPSGPSTQTPRTTLKHKLN